MNIVVLPNKIVELIRSIRPQSEESSATKGNQSVFAARALEERSLLPRVDSRVLLVNQLFLVRWVQRRRNAARTAVLTERANISIRRTHLRTGNPKLGDPRNR